jgi:putative NADH-flavin reductase
MTLTVFGATGRTGRPLVEQALLEGHAVRAFVRSRDKLADQQNLSDDLLTAVEGDVTDAAPVAQAVRGADAVLSALGHAEGAPDDVQTVGTRHIVSAMQTHGVERFVSETGAGVKDERDEKHLGGRLMSGLLGLAQPKVLEDARNHAEVIRQSEGLDWVIVRAPRLTNGPRTGTYREGYLKLGPLAKIARADVADFMLREATSDERRYHREAPMVSY